MSVSTAPSQMEKYFFVFDPKTNDFHKIYFRNASHRS